MSLILESLIKKHLRLLTESVDGLDNLIEMIKKKYNVSDEDLQVVKEFIEKSECKKIMVEPIKMGQGVSLSDRVILNTTMFSNNFAKFLFILFHEIAHQYQFKKYGGDKMYDCYIGEMSDIEAAETMRKIELVADEFALRKLRQLVKLGIVREKDAKFGGFYKQLNPEYFVPLIRQIKQMLKSKNIRDHEKISEEFYNFVKVNL